MKSQRGDMLGLPSLLWHLAQLGQQTCQLYTPATLYPQINTLVLISDRRAIESRQKEQVTWKFPGNVLGIKPRTSCLVVQCLSQLCYCPPFSLAVNMLIRISVNKPQWTAAYCEVLLHIQYWTQHFPKIMPVEKMSNAQQIYWHYAYRIPDN